MTLPMPIRTPAAIRAVGSIALASGMPACCARLAEARARRNRGGDRDDRRIEGAVGEQRLSRSKPPTTGTPSTGRPARAVVVDDRDRLLLAVVLAGCRSPGWRRGRRRSAPAALHAGRGGQRIGQLNVAAIGGLAAARPRPSLTVISAESRGDRGEVDAELGSARRRAGSVIASGVHAAARPRRAALLLLVRFERLDSTRIGTPTGSVSRISRALARDVQEEARRRARRRRGSPCWSRSRRAGRPPRPGCDRRRTTEQHGRSRC